MNFCVPQLLSKISTSDLKNDKLPNMSFPCHCRDVEWEIKEVSSASRSTCGHIKRHRMILSAVNNRKKFPKLQWKKDYFEKKLNFRFFCGFNLNVW